MGKVKNLLSKDCYVFWKNIISSLLLFISLISADLLFRQIYCGQVSYGLVPFLFSLCWCALLTAVPLLFPRIIRIIYNILIAGFYVFLMTAHAFFYSFFGNFMSVSSIMFAGEGAGFFDWSYFNIPKKFIALAVMCVLIAVASAVIVPKTKYSLTKTLCIIAVIAASFGGVNLVKAGFINDTGRIGFDNTASNADIYDSFTDSISCMHLCGLYQYTFRDISINTGLDDFLNNLANSSKIKELDEYYASKAIDPDNEMTGVLNNKNLILIQLEAIDSWMLNKTAMPNLYKIQSESINFPNYYAPKFLYGATFNSENIVNTGLVSPVNSSKLSYFTQTSYPYSAANLFKQAGYTVNSFHRSNGKIYNRSDVHTNWGYEKYFSGADMNLSDYDLDSSLMDAYDKFVTDGKFMSFIITYSGHGPFNTETKESKLYYDELKAKLPSDAEEEYICALCHAYETDVFIGKLFEQLEKDGHIDDTAVIFYTDHYNHYVTDSEILEKYKGTSDPYMMCNVPFFIYSKDMPAQTVDKVVATYDVLPTIVNLFGLNCDGRYYLGNDAFCENGGYVIFPDKSWYDGEVYFKSHGSSSPTKLSQSRAEEINTRLDACWNTVKMNYFRQR